MSYLSCKQTAEILNLSQSTVKRLCDDGVLISMRTPGGHRRISLKSVHSWQSNAGRELAEDIGARREKIPLSHYEDFIKLLLNEQRADVDEAVRTVRRRFSVAELCDHTLAPALVKLGWMHQRGEIDRYQLNAACQRVRSLLFRLSERLTAGSIRHRAIGASVIGDPADLASLFAEVTLRELGWDAESLGADLSGASLGDAAQTRRASLVWVCYTHQQPFDLVLDHNRQLNARLPAETRLVIGGGALTPELRRSLVFHFFGDSLVHLSNYASTQFEQQKVA